MSASYGHCAKTGQPRVGVRGMACIDGAKSGRAYTHHAVPPNDISERHRYPENLHNEEIRNVSKQVTTNEPVNSAISAQLGAMVC